MNKRLKTFFIIAYAIYFTAMLWLLFFQRLFREHGTGMILTPFYTIWGDIKTILFTDDPVKWRLLMNLIGNIFMFVPIGFFLPHKWRTFRKFGIFIITALFIDLTIELTQYFLKLGWFDVDDIILNVLGMAAGYLVYRILARKFPQIIINKDSG